MKFKPGDKVRLTQKFIDEMNAMGFTWHQEMVGITMTIKEVADYNGYSVNETPYLVSELWIEEVPEDAGNQPDPAAC
jgi:hypothetical protein